MRVSWFSPLPPGGGAAALYTARLLPFFKARAEVVLWTPQSQYDRHLERWARVRCYLPGELPWDELNQADATLFHLGPEHAANVSLLDVFRLHPGIAVLHDGADLPEPRARVLGVIATCAATFRLVKEMGRWPVLLAPPPWPGGDRGLSHALTDYRSYAEMLLTFADESRRFCHRLTAEELAVKAGRELSLWTADAAMADVTRAAREILTLIGRPSEPAAESCPQPVHAGRMTTATPCRGRSQG
jgi:hypothetical protein